MGSAAIAYIAAAAVVLGFVTAILGLIGQRRAQKTLTIAEKTAGNVQTISVNVDGRMAAQMAQQERLLGRQAELLERQAQLIEALHASGVSVPPKPGEEKGGAH